MRFRATLLLSGRSATGIEVPDDVLGALGGGRRPPVLVTLREHTYRTTVGSLGGRAMIPVSAAVRAAAGVAAGDELEVGVEADTEPREVVAPADLAAGLAADAAAQALFDQLSPSHRSAYVGWIESAKKDETRQRRVAEAVRMLHDGRRQR